jgi:hypothetical protein
MREGLPDMSFIRQIPIQDVARELGIRVAGRNAAHCWRVGAHQNGDRTPSLSFHRNRAKCFVCDADALSPLDLVIRHEEFEPSIALKQAVDWICARWTVPTIAKNAKLSRPERWSTSPVGLSSFPLERFVRSGIWAKLGDGARSILVVLFCFAERDDVCISYRALARYSGVSSDATIARALRQLKQIGILESLPKASNNFRDAGRYHFTLDSPKFQTMLSSVHDQLRIEREGERELRAQRRNVLTPKREGAGADTQVQVLSSDFEVCGEVHTSQDVACSQEVKERKEPFPQGSRFENKSTYTECTLHSVKCESDSFLSNDEGTAFPFGWNLVERAASA